MVTCELGQYELGEIPFGNLSTLDSSSKKTLMSRELACLNRLPSGFKGGLRSLFL